MILKVPSLIRKVLRRTSGSLDDGDLKKPSCANFHKKKATHRLGMNVTNKDPMESYEFHGLIVEKKASSLSLCEFFSETGFDPSTYLSSTFRFSLNRLNDTENSFEH